MLREDFNHKDVVINAACDFIYWAESLDLNYEKNTFSHP